MASKRTGTTGDTLLQLRRRTQAKAIQPRDPTRRAATQSVGSHADQQHLEKRSCAFSGNPTLTGYFGRWCSPAASSPGAVPPLRSSIRTTTGPAHAAATALTSPQGQYSRCFMPALGPHLHALSFTQFPRLLCSSPPPRQPPVLLVPTCHPTCHVFQRAPSHPRNRNCCRPRPLRCRESMSRPLPPPWCPLTARHGQIKRNPIKRKPP